MMHKRTYNSIFKSAAWAWVVLFLSLLLKILPSVALCNDITSENKTIVEDDLKSRFWSEAPSIWKKLDEAIINFQGTIEQTSSQVAEGSQPPRSDTRRIEYAFNSLVGGSKYVLSTIPDSGSYVVTAFNKDYSFQITSGHSQQKPFISRYSQKPKELQSIHQSNLGQYLFIAKEFDGMSLKSIVDGTIAVDSIKHVIIEGKDRLQIDFRRKYIDRSDLFPCSVTLAPELQWAIVEFQESKTWGFIKGRANYQSEIKDIPFPKQYVEEHLAADGQVKVTYEYSFSKPELCRATAADFTLAAYHLSVPVKESSANPATTPIISLKNIALINIIILILLACWFWAMSYRKRTDTIRKAAR